MVLKIGSSSFPRAATSTCSALQPTRRFSQLAILPGLYNRQHCDVQQLKIEAKSSDSLHEVLKLNGRFLRRQHALLATSGDHPTYSELETCGIEGHFSASGSFVHAEGTNGKPGFISFYNRPCKREDEILPANPKGSKNDLVCLIGPAVLVGSFIFPSLYLRKMITAIFEDSLLTDFLILFFTEALFYCGVAVFLGLIDHLRRPIKHESSNRSMAPQLGSRISSVAVLALSLTIPMVTMGLVWPWTGPAASATLAPYLVGIMVQFAFEQYARYNNSPSWLVIPIIFQVYRLHQLNRAAQLVTALSLTVRGAETTSHNLAINSSLGVLLNVLQCLGVICIWSLSSFLMRFLPSATTTQRKA